MSSPYLIVMLIRSRFRGKKVHILVQYFSLNVTKFEIQCGKISLEIDAKNLSLYHFRCFCLHKINWKLELIVSWIKLNYCICSMVHEILLLSEITFKLWIPNQTNYRKLGIFSDTNLRTQALAPNTKCFLITLASKSWCMPYG